MEGLTGILAGFGVIAFVVLGVGLIIGSLIAALIIQLATKMVAGFKPGFGNAFIAALVGSIAGIVLTFVLGMVLGTMSGGSIITLVASFLLNSAVLGFLIKNATGSPLGFGKGCIVTIVEYIIMIVLAVVCFFLFGFLLGGH